MFIEYIPGRSAVHRLDARAKVIAFLSVMIVVFLFQNPLYNGLIALSIFGLAGLAHLPFRRLWIVLAPLIPVFTVIAIVAGYTQPVDSFTSEFARQVLFYSWPGQHLPVSVGGLLHGLTMLLRVLVMVVASSILTLTTPLDDFLQLMYWLHLPYEMSFIITTGIRFIPTMERKADMVLNAQRARGASIEAGGLIQRIRAYIPVMIPLIVDSIRMSENLACAMLNRGYGSSRSWTTRRKLRLRFMDYFTISVFISIVAGAILAGRHGLGRL